MNHLVERAKATRKLWKEQADREEKQERELTETRQQLNQAETRLTETQQNLENQTKLAQALAKTATRQELTDNDFNAITETFPDWVEGETYKKGQIVNFEGQPYIAIMDIEADNKSEPTKAKTSWQAYSKDMIYLDAYGDQVEVKE